VLLLPEAKARNQFAIPGNVLVVEVAEKPSSLTYEHQETAAACVVVLVLSEMSAELLNSLCQERHLYFGGSSVAIMASVIINNCFFCSLVQFRKLLR